MSLPQGTLIPHVSRRATKPRRYTLSLSLSLPTVTPRPHNTCLLSPARPTHSTLITRTRGVADSSCSPRQACSDGRLQTLQGLRPKEFTAGPAGRRAGLPDRRQRRQRGLWVTKKKARKQPESKEREGNHPDMVSQIARRGAHNPKTLGPKSAGARTACAATTCQSLNSATYSAGCCTNPGHKPRQRYLIPAQRPCNSALIWPRALLLHSMVQGLLRVRGCRCS